jgi:hypothetical protein
MLQHLENTNDFLIIVVKFSVVIQVAASGSIKAFLSVDAAITMNDKIPNINVFLMMNHYSATRS